MGSPNRNGGLVIRAVYYNNMPGTPFLCRLERLESHLTDAVVQRLSNCGKTEAAPTGPALLGCTREPRRQLGIA